MKFLNFHLSLYLLIVWTLTFIWLLTTPYIVLILGGGLMVVFSAMLVYVNWHP